MNTEQQAELQEAKETYVGRLFTLGSSILFLIGSVISIATAYKTYTRLLKTYTSQ
ncbi:hypothetical protein [Bacillus pseudomycoides]|uniref:hypothetical protein n=1 Tax=Bacillus pseudomycoides TaxID=64104 RepID=UPI0015CF5B1C|nr:hypothetical protein [Bacillus pseudomycoides]